MISYWEQESLLHYDHIVIGSGLVGLSTAIELKERFPKHRILIIERGILPSGASTRNAGFACMGSLTELIDDVRHTAVKNVVQLFSDRKLGLQLLRQRLGDERIAYRERGSHELIMENELNALDEIDFWNEQLYPVNQRPTYIVVNEKIAAFGLNTGKVKAMVATTCEGELHTGKMVRALIDYAIEKGIEIKTGVVAESFEDKHNAVTVAVSCGVHALQLSCSKLFICTNAFAKQLLPGTDVVPGRGQVLITGPIEGLSIQGIFHFDKGYYYFREIDNRILFGGGRNLDFAGETTTGFGLNDSIQQDLEEKLHTLILPGNSDIKIQQRWSGIMAFGKDKKPVVSRFGNNVYGAFRLGGMGVALGSLVAQQLVELAGG